MRMADNPPDPHQLCFWHSPRLAVSGQGSHLGHERFAAQYDFASKRCAQRHPSCFLPWWPTPAAGAAKKVCQGQDEGQVQDKRGLLQAQL
eukprot:1158152-Pelagomonas_calceolata.AAC.5